MSILAEVIASVFRPAVAALAIALALAVVTLDTNKNSVSQTQMDITDWSCGGLFKPFCRAFSN